jgi:hypothetical protein
LKLYEIIHSMSGEIQDGLGRRREEEDIETKV